MTEVMQAANAYDKLVNIDVQELPEELNLPDVEVGQEIFVLERKLLETPAYELFKDIVTEIELVASEHLPQLSESPGSYFALCKTAKNKGAGISIRIHSAQDCSEGLGYRDAFQRAAYILAFLSEADVRAYLQKTSEMELKSACDKAFARLSKPEGVLDNFPLTLCTLQRG